MGKIKLKQNGFTFIELLAAVALLGIISTIAIASVSKIIESSHSKFDQKQYDIFIQAAQNYFTDHKKRLPLTPMESKAVTLQKLIDEKYLDNLLDSKKEQFDYQKSKVVVTRLKSGKYKYEGILYYKNGTSIGSLSEKKVNNNSGITFVLESKNNYYHEGNIYYIKDIPKVRFTINDQDGIAGYQYIIYKDGEQFKKSENIEVNGDTTITDSVDLGLDFPFGKYSIKVVSYDKYGNKSTNSTSNTNSSNSFYIYIDRIKPTCSISVNGIKGDNGWYKERNITLTLEEKDKESGILKHGLDSKQPSLVLYKNTLSAVQSDTAGTTWYGLVQDKAGNLCDTNITVKVDTRKPSCSIYSQSSSEKINQNKWYNKYTAYKIEVLGLSYRDDGPSGVNRHILASDDNTLASHYQELENNDSVATMEGVIGYYGYVRDYAGNYDECNITVKKDTIDPECPAYFDISYKQNPKNRYWSSQLCCNATTGACWDCGYYYYKYVSPDVTFTWKDFSEDTVQGIAYVDGEYYGMYNNYASYTIAGEEEYYGTHTTELVVYDEAKNDGHCTGASEKNDEVDLSCPYVTASTKVKTWTNKTVNLEFSNFSKDTVKYDWYTDYNNGKWTKQSTNSTSSTKKDLIAEGKRRGKLVIYDKDGNSKECGTGTYYIDKSPPELRAICRYYENSLHASGYWCEDDGVTSHVWNGVFVRIYDKYSKLGESSYTISVPSEDSKKTTRSKFEEKDHNYCINYSRRNDEGKGINIKKGTLTYKLCDSLGNCGTDSVKLNVGDGTLDSNYTDGNFGGTTCSMMRDGHACTPTSSGKYKCNGKVFD